jgi:hypothetical protein
MENLDALLAILLLKQPLAESFRVFNNPVKILQWILLQIRTQRVLSLCLSAHYSMPSSRENSLLLLSELTQSSQCTLHWLNDLAELQESSVILSSSELTTEFFLCALLALLNAHLAELYRTPQRFCLQLCSSTQPCLLRCSTTSRSSSELMISASVPTWHVFV